MLGRRISHRYYTYTDDSGSPGPSAEKPEVEPKRAPGPAARAKAARTKTAPTKAARTKTGQRDRSKPAATATATAPAKKRGARTGQTDGTASGGRRATGSGAVRSLLDRLRGR